MVFNLLVEDVALSDIQAAIDYYSIINQQLAEKFYKELEIGFDSIIENPQHFSFYSKNCRRYPLKKFPYIIVFLIHNNTVVILGVFYEGRNPEIIKSRLL